MSSERKLCPMQFDGPRMSIDESYTCLGDQCAWWDVEGAPGDGQCALLVLAQRLRDINFYGVGVIGRLRA